MALTKPGLRPAKDVPGISHRDCAVRVPKEEVGLEAGRGLPGSGGPEGGKEEHAGWSSVSQAHTGGTWETGGWAGTWGARVVVIKWGGPADMDSIWSHGKSSGL